MNYSGINIPININNIDLIIKSIIIKNDDKISILNPFISIPASPAYSPYSPTINIIAETSYKNYSNILNWTTSIFSSSNSMNYKLIVFLNHIKLHGVFPINTNLNQYNNLEVTFAVDYIEGDLEAFNLKRIRKDKLEKLNSLCQKSL